jgi:hypothetical protein
MLWLFNTVLYRRLCGILEAVQSKVPKLVLYAKSSQATTRTSHAGASSDTAVEKGIDCKCMLMSNEPLPDFCVQWADGAVLRYSLRTGKTRVDCLDETKSRSIRWEGSLTSTALPANRHISNSQELMRSVHSIPSVPRGPHGDPQWCDADNVPRCAKPYLATAQRALVKCFASLQSIHSTSHSSRNRVDRNPIILVEPI